MLNKVILMGRMTADPVLETTEAGISVCRFSVAVPEDFTREDGTRDVDFIDATAWRDKAEFLARNFKKGQLILIEGKLKVRSYEKDGTTRYATSVRVGSVYFAGFSKNQSSEGNSDINGEAPDLSEFEEILADTEPVL